MKILITGGAGFIGYYIAKNLSEDKNNFIHIVDNLSKSEKDEDFLNLIEKDNVIFSNLDLTDLNAYSNLENKYEQIYHLAAIVGVKKVMENPIDTLRVNVLSTLYLLDYISNLKSKLKILFSSSSENYACSIKVFRGKIPTPENIILSIDDVYNPRWSYAISKILGEFACIHYARRYNFNTTIIRYHNIYGPRMGTNHVIPEFILRLIKDKNKFEIYGGNQYRSFCYVEDAAQMTINLMNIKNSNNKIVNVGDDNYVKISDLAKILFKIMKISPIIVEKGAPEGSIEKRKPDLTLIKELNCFVSRTDFIKGLKKTLDWYLKKYS
ncbi:MAG: NAD-dependent epimerase/dehydratase family protein [Promethearchaeota archaeon]